jgi:thiamine-monophosphate kinase
VRSEDAIVSSLRKAFRGLVAKGALGLTDDAAVMPEVPRGHTRVVSTDMVVEEVDFACDLYPARLAGHRVMLQNLSDLAAMGARPVGFVWSLAIPQKWTKGPALAQFFAGAARLCRLFDLPLYGGDLSGTSGPFAASVTIFGDVPGTPLTRDGARPGDGVYVSASGVGAAASGLATLLQRRVQGRPARGAFPAYLGALPQASRRTVRSYLERTPEIALGQLLVRHASACLDVSDGLGKDLGRLAKASSVRLDLSTPALLAARSKHAPANLTALALLDSAEEYVLAFTARRAVEGAHRIGEVRAGRGVFLDGRAYTSTGFDHFHRSKHT